MADWTRRRLLLLGLGAGSVASGLYGVLRQRELRSEQAELTKRLLGDPEVVNGAVASAIDGDLEATAEVRRIMADLDLRSPDVPYERSMSRTLIRASRLATEQYLTGKFDLRYDGSIRNLPSHDGGFEGYTQVASIKGPDTVDGRKTIQLDEKGLRDPLLARSDRLRGLVRTMAGQGLVVRWRYPVYWGFVLTSPDHHLLVLRGTQRAHEWLQTIQARQIPAAKALSVDLAGSVHDGFATIYRQLSGPVLEAVRRLDPARPLYLSGHSLGAPLATLAAADIARRIPALSDALRLYTYAGPRLGNPAFAEAFSRLVPNSYRIVNLADLVPNLPPTETSNIIYVHLGQEWSFATSTGDIGPNHFISAYREAVDRGLEQPAQRGSSRPA